MRTLLVILCLVLAAPAPAGDPAKDPGSGFVFPGTIGEFRLKDRQTFDDPRLGYGVNYWNADGTLITLILYTLGFQDIADGLDDPRVRQQFEQAQRDMGRAVTQGAYRSASRVETATRFSERFAQASFDLVQQDGERLRSHILLRGTRRHFLKIRATGPATRQTDVRVATFLKAVGPLLGFPE